MHKIVLDTNVLVSALMFGGLPRELLDRVLAEKVTGVTSPALVEELLRTLKQKFGLSDADLAVLQEETLDVFTVVVPETTISVLKDEPDNRVLETAVSGMCAAIVTGDKELLALGSYKGIAIMSIVEYMQGGTNE